MTNKIKIFSVFILLGLIACFGIQKAAAKSLEIGKLTVSYEGSDELFKAVNIAPGYEEARMLTVRNNGAIPHSFSIATTNNLGPLAEVLRLEAKSVNETIFKKDLKDIAVYPNSTVIFTSIGSNKTIEFQLIASLPTTAGNKYQGTSTFDFKFIVGNESTDQKESNVPVEEVKSNLERILTSSVPTVAINDADNVNESTNAGAVLNRDSSGEVEGASSDQLNIWWPLILLIAFAVYLIILSMTKRAKKRYLFWILPTIIAILVYAMFLTLSFIYPAANWHIYFPILLISELGLHLTYW